MVGCAKINLRNRVFQKKPGFFPRIFEKIPETEVQKREQ